MLFNFGKSKCLYTGHENLDVNYELGDTVVSTTVKENDLGITIRSEPYSACTQLYNCNSIFYKLFLVLL